MELICAVELLGNRPGERIGLVKFGETGYYPAHMDNADYTPAQVKQAILEFNVERGISEDVALSAKFASIFGWHVPAADLAKRFAANRPAGQ